MPHPHAPPLTLPPFQVTNPPIDPLREGLVMSMEMRLGGRGNLLAPGARVWSEIKMALQDQPS